MFDRLAPFLFVLLWSSSFVAAKVGLQHLSPLLFVAVRQAGCAGVLVLLMLMLRRPWDSLRNWRWLHCGIAGAALNALGLMAPHVALTMVPAAQVALVQSLTPLLTALLGVILLDEHLRLKQWLGLVLGMAGVGLVVGHAALDSPTRFLGLVLAFVGVLGLVGGTLYFARFCRGVKLRPGATAQGLAATLVSAAGARLLETPRADWAPPALAAVVWNTVLVSLGGMGLYSAMLARGTAAHVSANFYLVPGAAAFLAWVFVGEGLTGWSVAGLVVASAGCWLVTVGGRR